MKYLRSIVIITFVLFIIGFVCGYPALKMTETISNITTGQFNLWDSLTPNFSLGVLLAFCSIHAGIILWAYSKNRFLYSPWLIFGSGLLILLISAVSANIVTFLVGRKLLSSFDNITGPFLVNIRIINYFSGGYSAVFFVGIGIAIILLWTARLNEKQINNQPIAHKASKYHNITLIIVSVMFVLYTLISIISYLCGTISAIMY